MKNIAIIGGWAAGMMCAAKIIEDAIEMGEISQIKIHLFEKNNVLWRKVSISGGWRCNVTTGISDRKILLSKYTRGSDFFKRSLGKFGPKKVVEWFESHAVRLKCEDDQRVFPVSDNGGEVIWAFESLFRKYAQQIDIHFSTSVTSISRKDTMFIVETSREQYACDIVVLTTGWNAYAHTGSSGDGYTLASQLWHEITKLGPSLSSFELKEEFPKNLSGIAFERSTLTSADGRIRCDGPILLTHFGISGPLTFTFSSQIAFETIGKDQSYNLKFAPLCGWDMQSWDNYLEKECRESPTKLVGNILVQLLPKRFVEELKHTGFITNTHVILDKHAANLSRDERKALARLLGEWIPLTVVQRRAGDEFVTAGGVDTTQIDDETLESQITPGLYFAGEVLNIDGVTGGFNLQCAWATGWNAGKSIASKLTSQSK